MTQIAYGTRLLNGAYLDDGFAFCAAAEKAGLKPIAGWGQDGWDLLDWPYYVLAAGKLPAGAVPEGPTEKFVYLTYCEGDLTLAEFDTKAELYAGIDELAVWFWRSRPDRGPKQITEFAKDLPVDQLPAWMRGPYRKGDTCEVCGEEITYEEAKKLREDRDFVEHNPKGRLNGHLIRVVPREYLDA